MNTLIISGGELDKEFLKSFLDNNKIDNIITADRGLETLDSINIIPNHILGDFDSINNKILKKYEEKDFNIIRLNPIKDLTDTHEALKLAIEQKSSKIYILGALGKRFDHAIANIHILKEALEKNVECKIIDQNNEIRLITSGLTKIEKDEYKYISLIPLTTEVTGITLKGFKYLLENAKLEIGHSIGVSNELEDISGTIEIKNGILILIKSKD